MTIMRLFRRPSSLTGVHPGGAITRSEALACRPVKNREVQEQKLADGDVLLICPLIIRPWLASLARGLGLRNRKPLTRKLRLDEMGTLVWTLVDGERTLGNMVDIVSHRYRLNRRETEVAMTTFLRELGRRGLIGFRPPPGAEDSGE